VSCWVEKNRRGERWGRIQQTSFFCCWRCEPTCSFSCRSFENESTVATLSDADVSWCETCRRTNLELPTNLSSGWKLEGTPNREGSSEANFLREFAYLLSVLTVTLRSVIDRSVYFEPPCIVEFRAGSKSDKNLPQWTSTTLPWYFCLPRFDYNESVGVLVLFSSWFFCILFYLPVYGVDKYQYNFIKQCYFHFHRV